MSIDAQAWRVDFETLHTTLITASASRNARRDIDNAAGEIGWVLHERAVMHDAANAMRARLGKFPLTPEEVLHAETSASGHSDYGTKFALRLADAVHA